MKRLLLLTSTAALALATSAWAAAPAPSVATSAAGGIGPTRATFAGSVNPNGAQTQWYFQYGATTAYGQTTPRETIAASSGWRNVDVAVAGLTAGASYHFRIVAASSSGMSIGADESFATPGALPGVTTLAATALGAGSARLNGSVNPNGLSTDYYFAYGTTSAYGARTPTRSAGSGRATLAVAADLGGLKPGTSYDFELVAFNAAGTTTGGGQSLTTFGAPAVQASAPQSLTPGSATLTGTVDTDGEATSWHFVYGTTTSYGSSSPAQSLPATAGQQTVTTAVSGLTPNATYHFQLVAYNGVGSNATPDASFATPVSVTVNPAAPRVVDGRYIDLTGNAWGGQPGVSVTILAQPFGQGSPAAVATVLTGAGGNWSYPARPGILTSYSASAEGGTSGTLTVAVRPAVTLRVLSGARLLAHVGTAALLQGRFVQLQRWARGGWHTVAHRRLDDRASATFADSTLPRGRSLIRIAVSVNEAGPGYLAGFSRELRVNAR